MKKPTKKNNLQLSVNEFKSWMSGVEDMQESGWVPNKTQWERIRSKIALLSDEANDRSDSHHEVTQQPQIYPNHQLPYPVTPVTYQEQAHQPTYYEPQQFEAPQFSTNDVIAYSSGEAAEFI